MTNAAIEILQIQRDQIAADIESLQAKVRAEKVRLQSIDSAIETLMAADIGLDIEPRNTGLKATIIDILSKSTTGLGRSEILSELSKVGIKTTENAISSTLSRLRADGLADKHGDVWLHTAMLQLYNAPAIVTGGSL
jgi:hypothetical protein